MALDGFLVVAVLVYHSYSLFIFCSLVGAVHCQSMVGFARDVRFPAIFYLRDNIGTYQSTVNTYEYLTKYQSTYVLRS